MAHRVAAGYAKSMLQQNSRSFSTASDGPPRLFWGKSMGHWAPVAVVFGFVGLATIIGMRTGYQQMVHNPNVYLSKGKREMIPELDHPIEAVNSGSKYVNKSVLRKVAHIQDDSKQTMPNPVQGSIYNKSRHADTLASIKD